MKPIQVEIRQQLVYAPPVSFTVELHQQAVNTVEAAGRHALQNGYLAPFRVYLQDMQVGQP
jgi:hypothetical protein